MARLTRVLLAAAAAAALVLFGAAAPARAQAQPTLGVFMQDHTIPMTGAGAVARIIVFASETVRPDHEVVTFDFSDIASFATVTPKPSVGINCSTSAAVLTCQYVFPFTLRAPSSIPPDVVIAPTGSAALGDEGTLRVTFSADGLAPASHDARIRIGTPVDLVGGPPAQREAPLGGSFTHSVQVSNVGANAVSGAVVTFDSDPGLRAGTKFANCTYIGDRPRSCRFDQVLNPGTTYQVAVPYVVGADTPAPSQLFEGFGWMTIADYEDLLSQVLALGGDPGQPGSGGTLGLTEVGPSALQGADTDTQPNNNFTFMTLSVTGHNDADLAAIGARLTGGAGDLVTATVGETNNGPAYIDRGRQGSTVVRVHVKVPPGTTAVTVPADCLPEAENGRIDTQHPGQPGQPLYLCAGHSFFFGAGETVTFSITLRIDQVIADAKGSASILVQCACDELPLSADRDHSNNTADIVVNPTTPDASTLPTTGSRVGLVVGLGGLLLVLGAAAIVAARRRLPFLR